MTSATDDPAFARADDRPSRGAGAMLMACALVSVGLLASHPDGAPSHVLADVIRQEAASQLQDAIIHGGFVLVLTLELACLAVLAVRVGARRTGVLTAMAFTLAGTGLLAASMILDGLVTPMIAARYLAVSAAKQENARTMLVLVGACLQVLMPMGLGVLGAGAALWGAALVASRGVAVVGGVIALCLGAAIVALAGFSTVSTDQMVLMLAIMAQAAWVFTAGAVLFAWRRPAAG